MSDPNQTTPPASGDGGLPAGVPVVPCPMQCPDMELQVNNTATTDDDMVRLQSSGNRPLVECRIRATSPCSSSRVELVNPDGRLRFPGELDRTRTVSLSGDGSWTPFQISGQMGSDTAHDAIIEAHCDQATGPVKATIGVTVCSLVIESETELTFPSDRNRTRIAVSERVQLTATGAKGTVNWSISAGHGTLSATSGGSITFTAPDIVQPDPAGTTQDEIVSVQARDAMGCVAVISFTVACNYLITKSRLQAIFTTAPQSRLDDLTQAFNESFNRFSIDTCLRKAHFFAQVLTEVGTGANPREENLNYTPAALQLHFRYFRRNPAEAQLFGRTQTQPANQQAIANRAYANRIGNGNVASGDGWRFRGRGYIQLTGRANYTAIQAEINLRFPGSGIDIVNNFNDIVSVRGGMISAMAYWSRFNLNQAADGGDTNADVDAVTNRVNRGTPNPGHRRNHFHNTTALIFRTANCPRRPI